MSGLWTGDPVQLVYATGEPARSELDPTWTSTEPSSLQARLELDLRVSQARAWGARLAGARLVDCSSALRAESAVACVTPCRPMPLFLRLGAQTSSRAPHGPSPPPIWFLPPLFHRSRLPKRPPPTVHCHTVQRRRPCPVFGPKPSCGELLTPSAFFPRQPHLAGFRRFHRWCS
jgi:hypothetical protein